MSSNSGQIKSPWLGLVFINISLLIVSLDETVMNVALPSFARDLGATTSELQWIVDAYILVLAALLLTMGALGDRYGRKRLLQLGVLSFGLFSLLAAFSRTVDMLVAARGLLGIGAAIIMPSTLSMISAIFPDSKDRARAIAIWAAMFGLGGAIGPIVGGWLVDHFHWSAVFYINIPFAVVALIGGQLTLPESRDEGASRPDFPGVILSSFGMLALVYAIVEVGSSGWHNPQVFVSFGVSLVLLSAFLWWEKRSPNAMMPLSLFNNMGFTVPNILMTVTMFGMFSVFFLMTQFFQGIQGYSPLETGIRFLPMAVLSVVVSANSANVVRRLGIKRAMVGGLGLATGGLLFLGLIAAQDTSYWLILAAFIVMFAGIDTAMPAATMSIMDSIPPAKAGVGSAMNEMTGQIGGALGIAGMGALANKIYLDGVHVLQGDLSAEGFRLVRTSIFGAYQAAESPTLSGEIANQVVDVAERAFISGMSASMFMGVAVLAATIILVAVVLPRDTIAPAD